MGADNRFRLLGQPGALRIYGFAWYRRHLEISLAPGINTAYALLIPPVDDVYEVYWNGNLIWSYGKLPPPALVLHSALPRICRTLRWQLKELGSVGCESGGCYSSSPRRLLTRTMVSICSCVSRDNRFRRTEAARTGRAASSISLPSLVRAMSTVFPVN